MSTLAAMALAIAAAAAAWAQWSSDPRAPLALGLAARHADAPRLVTDGRGGAIVVWEENESSGVSDVRVQHVDSTGAALWEPSGMAPSEVIAERQAAQALSDGSGGAILVWQELRRAARNQPNAYGANDWDLYAQHIDSTGALRWDPRGVVVSTAPGDQLSPRVATDGHGGVLVTWENRPRKRGGGRGDQALPPDTLRDADVYAQRIDSSGTARWAQNGVPVASTSTEEFLPTIVTDGQGGAYVTWVNLERPTQIVSVGAQRVDGHGNVMWRPPIWIARDAAINTSTALVSDGQGGAIVVWNGRGILARRIGPTRERRVLWGEAPVLLSSRVFFGAPVAVSDGQGGALVAWSGGRNPDVITNVFAQRVTVDGVRRWGELGIAVCPARTAEADPAMARDGHGGAIIAWRDARSGAFRDLYAQRVDSTGTAQWARAGVPVCFSPGDVLSLSLVRDGSGGAIVAWQDRRIDGGVEVAHLTSTGSLGASSASAPR